VSGETGKRVLHLRWQGPGEPWVTARRITGPEVIHEQGCGGGGLEAKDSTAIRVPRGTMKEGGRDKSSSRWIFMIRSPKVLVLRFLGFL
jgi:hypothetical protein